MRERTNYENIHELALTTRLTYGLQSGLADSAVP